MVAPKKSSTARRTTARKKPAAPSSNSKSSAKNRAKVAKTSRRSRLLATAKKPFIATRRRVKNLQSRRPHRSFRRTRRRDYKRSLKLPGYVALSAQVLQVLRKRRWLYLQVAVLYALLVVLFGGMTSQETYQAMGEAVSEAGSGVFDGNFGKVGEASILAASAFLGGSGSVSEAQQIYMILFLIMTWLTTVWLLREQLAGKKPRLRDGLYNSGAPMVSTMLVVVMLLVQLIPVGILAVVYSGLSGAGIIQEGLGMLLASAVGIVAGSLTLYWIVSTFFALIIVTLPGMYPMRAMRAAGDVVVGRRLRITLRVVWAAVLIAVAWFVIVVPLVLLVNWAQSHEPMAWLKNIPVAPFAAAVVSSLSMVYFSSYIYLLYRKVIDDDAAPA